MAKNALKQDPRNIKTGHEVGFDRLCAGFWAMPPPPPPKKIAVSGFLNEKRSKTGPQKNAKTDASRRCWAGRAQGAPGHPMCRTRVAASSTSVLCTNWATCGPSAVGVPGLMTHRTSDIGNPPREPRPAVTPSSLSLGGWTQGDGPEVDELGCHFGSWKHHTRQLDPPVRLPPSTRGWPTASNGQSKTSPRRQAPRPQHPLRNPRAGSEYFVAAYCARLDDQQQVTADDDIAVCFVPGR
jgi:hypothetical protein